MPHRRKVMWVTWPRHPPRCGGEMLPLSRTMRCPHFAEGHGQAPVSWERSRAVSMETGSPNPAPNDAYFEMLGTQPPCWRVAQLDAGAPCPLSPARCQMGSVQSHMAKQRCQFRHRKGTGTLKLISLGTGELLPPQNCPPRPATPASAAASFPYQMGKAEQIFWSLPHHPHAAAMEPFPWGTLGPRGSPWGRSCPPVGPSA